MSKEREFLKKLRYATHLENDLRKELEELLAQPEQEIYAKGYAEAMKQQVYEAYESGRKSALTEQEPVAWCQMVEEKVQDLLTSFEMKDWLYDKSWIPLYTAPPKREPLGLEIMDACGTEDYREGFKDGALYAEKCHGIGVDDE